MTRPWSARFVRLGCLLALVGASAPRDAGTSGAEPLSGRVPLEAPPVRSRSDVPSRQPGGRAHQPLAAPPVTYTPEVARLIEQLGDDSFIAREAASGKLAARGLAAKPALMLALKHGDPEVRLRARRLLGEIQTADLEVRLKAFVADTECREEHEIPGWDRFRKS